MDRGSRALDHVYILPVQQHEPGDFPAARHAPWSHHVHVLADNSKCSHPAPCLLGGHPEGANAGVGVVFALLVCIPLSALSISRSAGKSRS
ncbi:hypothetical protein BDZ89DRAFT_1064036 [Hymenopellis radicata]|nr:hypothetical protein BDZ89DRAFT_1064036 [Hymenopellis radicata]